MTRPKRYTPLGTFRRAVVPSKVVLWVRVRRANAGTQATPKRRQYVGPVDHAEAEGLIASFEQPPIVEVLAAVRFAGLSASSVFALSNFQQAGLGAQFTGPTLQPPYEAPMEAPGSQVRPGFGVEVSTMPPLPRLWYTAGEGQELVQLQSNWFAVNWRRTSDRTAYDRWPSRRESFVRYWTRLREWAGTRGDDLVVEQTEITYINHIQPIDGIWEDHASASRLFPSLAGPELDQAVPEQFSWEGQYRVVGAEGGPARLHVSIQPAFTGHPSAVVPIVVLQLTERSAPLGQTDAEVIATLDRGRATIVQSFVQLTSEEARRSWGQH